MEKGRKAMGWCGMDVRARIDAYLKPKCCRVHSESLRCSGCITVVDLSRETKARSVFIDESNVPSLTTDDERRKTILVYESFYEEDGG